ncbi:MAG: site-2 protease family protein [Candidatus Nomurabacteria bacterium]|nr:MAG: site-2 protease family protein [Candidatus Nomurabacteria bacterium]
MLLTLIVFIVVFSVVVFVHEFGHFSAARKLGVKVEEFGFGFPPRIAGIRRGDTIYSINWIPFGGFVRLKGESGENVDPDSFVAQAPWKRVVILSAGVLMNVITAAVLLSIAFGIGIPSALDQDQLASGGQVSDHKLQIVTVVEGSPAEKAGLAVNDVIEKINGQEIRTVSDLQAATSQEPIEALELQYSHENESKTLTVTPEIAEGDTTPKIGVAAAETGLVRYPWYQALWLGPWYTLQLLWLIIVSLFELFKLLFTQGMVSPDVAGPIGIAVVTGQVAKLGFVYVLQFTAVLSLSLAVMNILPIPALDGGRVFFVLLEKVRGKAVSPKVEGLVHTIGFYALILFILVISIQDINRFNIGDRVRDFFQSFGS